MQLVPIPSLINGYSYGWSDIQLSIAGGVPVYDITSIEYSTKRKIENIYGAGSAPVSRGYGNVEYAGSITIKLQELVPLRSIAPFGDITQIPEFTITIAYLDQNLNIIINTLNNVQFMADDLKTKQNDTSIDITIPLVIGSISY